MDELLLRRLTGAVVLFLAAFFVTALLPDAERPEDAASGQVVRYRLAPGGSVEPQDGRGPPTASRQELPEARTPRLQLAPALTLDPTPAAPSEKTKAPEPAQRPEPTPVKPTPQKPAPAAPVPAVTATPKKVEPAPPTAAATGGGEAWMVQVGSFGDPANAKALQQKLRSRGFPVQVDAVALDGQKLHRVRVGPYHDEGEAQGVREQLRGTGHPSARVFSADPPA